MDRLAGKTAVVTGAASGIGEATARLFASEGANVLIADLQDELGERVVSEIGERAHYVHTDVSAGEDVQAMFRAAADRWGGIDIIYNNAGIGRNEGNVRDCAEERFDRIIAVNLRGPWLGMKYGIPYLEARGGGSIISTASIAGLTGLSGIAAYCASKGGVIALTRAAAGEWARSGIRVNCICPGGIVTNIGGPNADPEGQRATLSRIHPIGRAGEGLDIAQAALWLASDESSLVTGQAIVVDGGWTGIDARYDVMTGRV